MTVQKNSILTVPATTFAQFKARCVAFAQGRRAILENTGVFNQKRDTMFESAFKLVYTEATGRMFILTGTQQLLNGEGLLSSVLLFGDPSPQLFDGMFMILLARAFPELYLQVTQPPVLARLVPKATFEAAQVDLITVSNAVSLASSNQTIVGGAHVLLREVLRLETTLDRIPDHAYQIAAVNDALTAIQGFLPMIQVRDLIANTPQPAHIN